LPEHINPGLISLGLELVLIYKTDFMKYWLKYILIGVLFIFSACQPEIDTPDSSSGDADFTVFVALGNSLMAGYTDSELYLSAQENSFPALIAKQMAHVGNQGFNQPLMHDDLGFGRRLILSYVTDCRGETILSPVKIQGNPDPANFQPLGNDVYYHNMGVPGAKVADAHFTGYAILNPYYQRFARDLTTSSMLGDAMQANPTFFALWLGNNDILTYATNGGEAGSVTPVNIVNNSFQIILQTLTQNGAKGAIANIPYFLSAPFFNAIAYNDLILDNQQQVDALNEAYAQLPHINFIVGRNPFVVYDNTHASGIRQLQEGEKMLMNVPLDSIKCEGWGTIRPIPGYHYLSITQVESVNNSINAYNQSIENFAQEFDLALVDVQHLMQVAESGIYYNGVNLSNQYLEGGIFSIDGLHLTQRGSAFVANHFIEAINTKFRSSIPKVNVTDYQGIFFP
jgi:lysophospholipase L1-like esterase